MMEQQLWEQYLRTGTTAETCSVHATTSSADFTQEDVSCIIAKKSEAAILSTIEGSNCHSDHESRTAGAAPPGHDWFSQLFGFSEMDYDDTKKYLRVTTDKTGDQYLESLVTKASYCVGRFTTPKLSELREQCSQVMLPGRLQLKLVTGDVSKILADPQNQLATVQAASQFNCLEFPSQFHVPEDGVTNYVSDTTQGPACSIACGPATVLRNYFASVFNENGDILQHGQTSGCQIDNLADFGCLVGNDNHRYFEVVNGYTIADDDQLAELNAILTAMSATHDGKRRLLDAIRVGVHSGVQVTSCDWGDEQITDAKQRVTQVFNSACAVAYNSSSSKEWEPFAKLALEAAYEGALSVALLEAERHGGAKGSKTVYLTCIGGGVFGNDIEWIVDAMKSALERFRNFDLDVRINCYCRAEPELEEFVDGFECNGSHNDFHRDLSAHAH